MFDYFIYMINIALLDGSCKNCAHLFSALEEVMASTAPVAILFTSDGSILLYMEDRFLIENIYPQESLDLKEDSVIQVEKEQRRKHRKETKKHIKLPKSNLKVVYKRPGK